MNNPPLFENESEKSFLALLLLRGASGNTDFGILPEDFYNDLHKRIFTVMIDLIDHQVQIDPVSVINLLKEKALFRDETKESDYIISLYNNAIMVQPLSYYSKRIKKLSDRRKYIQILQSAIQFVHTDSNENETVFTKIEGDLSRISRATVASGLRSIKEDKDELIDYIKTMYETKGATSGLRTHFHELDEVTTGLKKHELFILAARPGIGKTTFALNIAANVALKEKGNVAIFSMEMSRLELLIKMICSDARINSNLLKTGALHPGDQSKLINSIVNITSSSIYIDDSGALTIWEFKSRIRQLLITNPLSLIVVDYLQLMDDPTVKESRQQVVSSVSRNLKQMAREAECPIIALSQLSRDVEKRSRDNKPQLSDLRESGAIEQDADIVAFIHRERDSENIPEDKKNMAELIIAKNRAGAQKTFDLIFTPEYSRFDNV
ncbi:MAG: replicative DNA helicase [Leptospiraceae bacterium]|nr:replicative DNA helicase [Leptospiraceae bacterium]MCP5512075.1 replicative DNA helicase [Leptospiraceae bacterium]